MSEKPRESSLPKTKCPSCASDDQYIFHHVTDVPVHSVMNIESNESARAFPRGSIELALCRNCGFITNRLFDEKLLHYSTGYEATQAYSPTFGAFAKKLATRMVRKYDLAGKTVLEIGCGNGEFLEMLCNLSEGTGVGFDPAYNAERSSCTNNPDISIVKDFYSEKYSDVSADFIYCRMTLEHIPEVAEFVRTVRRAIGNRSVPVFFQVPNATRILQECAFEDVYYEHCSYFTAESLSNLFRICGFDVTETALDYGKQYVLLVAQPTDPGETGLSTKDIDAVYEHARQFGENFRTKYNQWRSRMDSWKKQGDRVVLWGSGSKAVSFLSSVPTDGAIEYTVDINPYRQGTFLAGTGHKIVSPDFLREYRPDAVVIMNRIYRDEIAEQVTSMGVSPVLFSL